jgi:hypothetical protein
MEKNISDPRALDGRNAAAKMSEHIAFNIIFAALRASRSKLARASCVSNAVASVVMHSDEQSSVASLQQRNAA